MGLPVTVDQVLGGKLDGVVSVGSKALDPGVHIAGFPCPKVNNSGVTGSWDWRVAASAAVAVLSTVAAYTIADMQYQTAKEYWRLARERWDYFLTTYRPCEKKEVAEAFTATPPKPNYSQAINAYKNGAALAFNKADAELMRLASLYCLCPDTSILRDTALTRSQMIGDGVNYAIRHEEAVAEALDDIRWNRQIAVSNRGRGLMAESASYARAAASMQDQYGKSISAVASGATSFIGYALNRNPTSYPQRNAMGGGYAGYGVGNMSGERASEDGIRDIIQALPQQPYDTGAEDAVTNPLQTPDKLG